MKESSHTSILSPMVIDSFEAETGHESQVNGNQTENEVSSEVAIEPLTIECPEEIDLIDLNALNKIDKFEQLVEEIDDHHAEYSSATVNVDDVHTVTLIDIDSSIENKNAQVVIQRDTLVGNWIDDLFGFNNSTEATMVSPIESLVPAGVFDDNTRQTVKRAIPDLLPLQKKTGPSKYQSTAGKMVMAVCADYDANFLLPNLGVQDNDSINIDFDVAGDFGKCRFH